MPTRKNDTTFAALQQQIAKLQGEASVAREKEKSAAIAQVQAAIRTYGLTAADLGLSGAPGKRGRNGGAPKAAVGGSPAKGAATTAGTRAKPGRRGPAANGAAPARPGAGKVKYTDGQGRTWSGIGKRPNWFKDALAAGKRPEDLLATSGR